jgi:hypothetical protein
MKSFDSPTGLVSGNKAPLPATLTTSRSGSKERRQPTYHMPGQMRGWVGVVVVTKKKVTQPRKTCTRDAHYTGYERGRFIRLDVKQQ